MGYINAVQINNDKHLIEPTLFATAGGTSTTMTAAINNFVLTTGTYVNIKVNNVSANATLNVNNTGAKPILYSNTAVTDDTLMANHVYTLLYDGTNWIVTGDIVKVNVNNHNLIFTSI